LVAEWEANARQARELGSLLHGNIQQHLVDGEVRGDVVICDWKRAKQMKFDNRWQKAKPPIQYLDDCDLSNYSLQLSLYRYLLRERLQERNVSLLLVNFTDRYTEIPVRELRDEVQALLIA
jgi:hypothetical protein